jgi:hypothetical protein
VIEATTLPEQENKLQEALAQDIDLCSDIEITSSTPEDTTSIEESQELEGIELDSASVDDQAQERNAAAETVETEAPEEGKLILVAQENAPSNSFTFHPFEHRHEEELTSPPSEIPEIKIPPSSAWASELIAQEDVPEDIPEDISEDEVDDKMSAAEELEEARSKLTFTLMVVTESTIATKSVAHDRLGVYHRQETHLTDTYRAPCDMVTSEAVKYTRARYVSRSTRDKTAIWILPKHMHDFPRDKTEIATIEFQLYTGTEEHYSLSHSFIFVLDDSHHYHTTLQMRD